MRNHYSQLELQSLEGGGRVNGMLLYIICVVLVDEIHPFHELLSLITYLFFLENLYCSSTVGLPRMSRAYTTFAAIFAPASPSLVLECRNRKRQPNYL